MKVGPYGTKILSDADIANLASERKPASAAVSTPVSAFSSEVHAPHVPPRVDAQASDSLARLWNTRFSPYNRTLYSDLGKYEESGFFPDYEESYKTNPFTFMLTEYVISQVLGDGFHFEGSGANTVDDFFWDDDTFLKLEMWYRDSVRYGNGFMDFTMQNGRLIKTRVLNPFDILVSIDINANNPTYGERTYWQGKNQLSQNFLMHGMLKQLTGAAYGMSLYRPNIVFLQALLDAGGDVIAALKRVGYAPIVARLDLDGYRTAAEKTTAIADFTANMENTESATNNFVIDRRNDINLLGTGSAGARLLPVNDLLEPWIAVCLRNFGFPIGIFLQQGANKAIVDAQREEVRCAFAMLRGRFKYLVEKNLLPRITSHKCEMVWNKPPPSSMETQASFKLYLLAYQLGLISKEYVLDYFDITDTGKEFFEGQLQQGASHSLGATKEAEEL